MPSKWKANCLSYSSFSIVQRRRKKASSAALPIPSEADQKVAEKVHYSTGASSVYMGQNVAYDETKYKYEDEAIYEVPT